MSEVYPDDGQQTPDEEWIAECGRRGWVALSKDSAIAKAHVDVVEKAGVVVILLPDASMSGAEQIDRFVRHRHRIALRAKKGGPAIYKLYPEGPKKVWP